MEEVTSNMTIAVMMVYLACHEEIYLGPKPKTGVFDEKRACFQVGTTGIFQVAVFAGASHIIAQAAVSKRDLVFRSYAQPMGILPRCPSPGSVHCLSV